MDAQWRRFFRQRAQVDETAYRACDYASRRSFQWRQGSVVDWVGVGEGRRVLDVGCGPGLFAAPWTEANEVTGIDFVRQMLARARGRGLRTSQADAGALPFSSGAYDLVLCTGVLQCVDDWRGALGELVRVVRPGGTLVVGTLSDSAARRILYRLKGAAGSRHTLRPTLFSAAELRGVLEGLGVATDVLTLYYPIRCRQVGKEDGWLPRLLGSSFAIRGRKMLEGSPR